MTITETNIAKFEQYLISSEREAATAAQYIRAVRRLAEWLGSRAADKPLLLEYKEHLKEHHAPSSVNAAIAAINGNPVDRSNIAKGMKCLAEIAQVLKKKVFPHNLRHLFARIYYSAYKDIARLADILGHSSINTTRIYTMESGAVHRRQIEQLRLV